MCTTQDLTFDAGWLSSDPAVATVSNDSGSKGLVRAIAAGTSTISATFDSVPASALLTVTTPALQSIAVSPANPTILSISKVPFKALGTYSDGSTADISTQVAWNSSNTGFATIDTGGTVKTLLPGTTSISATLAGVSGTSSVKVTGGVLGSITVSPANPKLVKDTTVRLTAMGAFNNNSSRDITGAVDWSVDVPSVATVTTPGGNQAWLNPLVPTSGTIVKATSGLVIGDATFAVVAPQLQDITIAPSSLVMTAGTSESLTVTAVYSDGTKQDVTASSDWASTNPTIATVDNTTALARGRVVGVAAGTTTITLNGKEHSIQMVGVTDDFAGVRNLDVVSGRFLDNIETVVHGKREQIKLVLGALIAAGEESAAESVVRGPSFAGGSTRPASVGATVDDDGGDCPVVSDAVSRAFTPRRARNHPLSMRAAAAATPTPEKANRRRRARLNSLVRR